MSDTKLNISFFCELPTDQLCQLFSNKQLIDQLKRMNANICMGMLDFSSERAAVIKQLTKAGIPVSAWLLLPKSQGYWTSLDTVSEIVRCYSNFRQWAKKNSLHFAAIGLDIEPKIERMKLFSSRLDKIVAELLPRLFSGKKYRQRSNSLQSLINQIRIDGYPVETYNFPFVVDERLADSNIFSKVLGTPPLEADREVLMLYSSIFKNNGDAVLWSYAHQAQAIGLGSTGGGVDLADGEPLRSLRWIDLRRDLLISKNFTKHIYIFSLEGCVKNGYLERLVNFDWNVEVTPPTNTGSRVTFLRKLLQFFLWFFSHLEYLLLPMLFLSLLMKKKRS
ncbi:MAG: hypothetical protein AB9897_08355 [Anaerolineaceae bacterium]